MKAGARPAAPETRSKAGLCSIEHTHGFSSLALLGGLERHRRALYLLDWSNAVLGTRRMDDGENQSTTLPLDGWERLPVDRASLDMVVVDLDAVPRGREVRRRVAAELGRIVRDGARCIAVISHRRRPRDRRAWSQYRLVPPFGAWRATLRQAGLQQLDLTCLDFDGPRLTGIALSGGMHGSPPRAGSSDAVALVLSRTPESGPSIVDELRRTLSRRLDADVVLDRINVRKIGKAAAFAEAGGSRVLVKLPQSHVALDRARRNYAALVSLHPSSAGIPAQLVPAPLAEGVVADQPYFVETVLPGVPRDAPVTESGWEPQALQFVTTLHLATAYPVLATEEWFDASIEPAIAAIERYTGSDDRVPLRWLRHTLRRQLIGHQLPLVRSHGDFTGSNCLYDAGRLSGVVDWELSRPAALPLLDLLQCFDLSDEYTPDGRWRRAELVFDAVENRGPLSADPEVRAYMTRMGIAEGLRVPLLLMHWVDHIGARVAVRRNDDRWFRGRVSAPLQRLRQLVQAG